MKGFLLFCCAIGLLADHHIVFGVVCLIVAVLPRD
jgi:hypothetical protein